MPHTQESRDAVRRGHRRVAKAQLWYPSGSQGDLPIKDGSVTFSLSDSDGQRKGRLTIPGYEWFDRLEPGNYAWVRISFFIDSIEVFDLGEFPIMDVSVERPGGEVEVALGDWSWRRSQPKPEVHTFIGSTTQTVASVCQEYMSHVMPAPFTITLDQSNNYAGGALVQTPEEVSMGGGTNVWEALTRLCNQVGCVLVCTSRHTAEIRRYDPYAPYHEDLTGTIISENIGVLPSKIINRIMVWLEPSDPGYPEGTGWLGNRAIEVGPYKYDSEGVGELTHSTVMRRFGANQAMAQAEADRLYERMAGVTRTQSLRIVPQPWIELGDILAWYPSVTSNTEPMQGMVNSFTLPLTTGGNTQGQSITLREALVR
jgi:hypothetical protein